MGGVGGVLDGERPERCCLGELLVEFGPVLGEAGQVSGEDGQAGVVGEAGCGGEDAWGPFPDAGVGGRQLVFEPTLGVAFGGGVAGGAGGAWVAVGDGVGGSPELDVGDQVGVEAGEVCGPVGRLVAGRLLAGLVGELVGEDVAGRQVGLPVGVVEQLGGDPGQPGQGPAGAVVGVGEVESTVDDRGRVAGGFQPAELDGFGEDLAGVVAVGGDQHQVATQGGPGVGVGQVVEVPGGIDGVLHVAGEVLFGGEGDGVEVAGDGGAEEPGGVVGVGEVGGGRDGGVVSADHGFEELGGGGGFVQVAGGGRGVRVGGGDLDPAWLACRPGEGVSVAGFGAGEQAVAGVGGESLGRCGWWWRSRVRRGGDVSAGG